MIPENRPVKEAFYFGAAMVGIGLAGRLFCDIYPTVSSSRFLKSLSSMKVKLFFDATALGGVTTIGCTLLSANRPGGHKRPLESASSTGSGVGSSESRESSPSTEKSDPPEPVRRTEGSPPKFYQPPSSVSPDHPFVRLQKLIPSFQDRAVRLDAKAGEDVDRVVVLATQLHVDEEGFRAFVKDKGPNIWDNSLLKILRELRRADPEGKELAALSL